MYVETHYAQLARALSSYLFKSKYTELLCISNVMDNSVSSDNAFFLFYITTLDAAMPLQRKLHDSGENSTLLLTVPPRQMLRCWNAQILHYG